MDKELYHEVETEVAEDRPAEVDKELGDPALQPLLLIYKVESSESADAARCVPTARDRIGYSRPEIAGGVTDQTYANIRCGIGGAIRSPA